jgi:imidazolonepropionase
VEKTNAASFDELFNLAAERIERLNSYGIGTIEIKSGYGLSFEKEWEISLLIEKLKKHGVNIIDRIIPLDTTISCNSINKISYNINPKSLI